MRSALAGESYSIGRLAGCGGVPADIALDVLLTAALAIPSYRASQPWSDDEIEKKVRGAFAKGRARPRPAWIDIERALDAEAEAADAG